MAVILAESVAITKSRLAKGFNGDNLNLNGKVLTTDDADNGFKAAGSVKPPYVAVVASGNQKGFAAGAVDAFNDYAKDINFNKYNAQVIIDKYFDDMQSVVDNCGIENGRLSIGIVCAYDDCVIAAKTGDCHLLRFSEGELFEIALSDDEGGRGFQFVDVIADGDVFALVGEEASADLDYDAIVNAFDSNADLKTIIRDFYKSLSVTAAGKDCSVVLMKLKSDTEYTYASAPAMMFSDDEDGNVDEFAAEPPIDAQELMVSDGYVSNSERPEVEKKPVLTKKKILSFIPIAVLIIILAITAALYFSTHMPSDNSDDGEKSSNPDIVIDADADVTGDYNGSNGMQEVDDTEHGGDVGDVEDEDDNNADTTTSSTITTEPERTTNTSVTPNRPSSTTTTTEAADTTTEATETTTEAADTTTEAQDTTTEAPDTTTQAPDTTTQAPDTTTQQTAPEEPVAELAENA